MEKLYGLTSTEIEIVEYFWSENRKVTFREIMEYFNTTLNKNWKKQTMSTYLKKLQEAKLIGADSSKKYFTYYSICTKEELIHNWTRKLIEDSFDSSLSNFVAAFSGGKKLSKEEAEKLKELI